MNDFAEAKDRNHDISDTRPSGAVADGGKDAFRDGGGIFGILTGIRRGYIDVNIAVVCDEDKIPQMDGDTIRRGLQLEIVAAVFPVGWPEWGIRVPAAEKDRRCCLRYRACRR